MLHDMAVIETKNIGNNVIIKEFSVIRPDVVIGNNVIIHSHVVIESGVEIGDNVEIYPGAYIGKEPNGAGATARKPDFIRGVKIGANSSIGPNVVIYCDVVIGRNTLLGDGASIREKCKIGDFCIISRYVTLNYNTIVGNRTKIMDLTHITGNARIGNDVFISVNVGTTNDNTFGLAYSEKQMQGPFIKDGVAIGAGVTLLPGIVIGEKAIIASGAVVTKNVKENTLVAGVPAKFVKDIILETV